uniref:Uncharacterized protein n=1 Tax=Molossus molossus TaxID=27622 RepID=A0A7J8HCN3_MOLMO|nr:hypothetical protein HJG59_011159 [Molossus molossus]
MPNNSFLPYVSLVPAELPPPCWSLEGVGPSKSLHRPFKRNCLGLQKPQPPSALIPTGFYSQKLWGLLFLAVVPWAVGSGVEWEPLIPQGGPSQPSYLPDYLPHMCVGPACPCLRPFYQSPCGFFFDFLVVGLHSAQFQVVLNDSCSVV